MAYNYKDDSIYIIRKDGGQKHSLFRFKKNPFSTQKAEYLCDLKGIKNYHVVTAMDMHESENALVVRTYKPDNPWQDSALYEYRYDNIEALCETQPKKLEHGQEGQGEAVSYKYREPGIVHLSEGYAPKIFNLGCGIN